MLLVMIGDDGTVRRIDPADLPQLAQTLGAQPPPAVSVGELAEQYLAFKASLSRGPEARTLRDYRQYLRDHVWPHEFGSLPAAQVTRAQARSWQNELLVKPKRRGAGLLGANSVIKIRSGLVAPAFRWATLPGEDGQPPLRSTPSPFLGLELPEPTPFHAATLESAEQIHLFIDLAYQVDDQWADLVVAALCTGFRFGEITAVGPAALRPRTSEVAALRRFSDGRLLPGTKSGRGEFRTVPVPEPVMAMLARRAAGKPPRWPAVHHRVWGPLALPHLLEEVGSPANGTPSSRNRPAPHRAWTAAQPDQCPARQQHRRRPRPKSSRTPGRADDGPLPPTHRLRPRRHHHHHQQLFDRLMPQLMAGAL